MRLHLWRYPHEHNLSTQERRLIVTLSKEHCLGIYLANELSKYLEHVRIAILIKYFYPTSLPTKSPLHALLHYLKVHTRLIRLLRTRPVPPPLQHLTLH